MDIKKTQTEIFQEQYKQELYQWKQKHDTVFMLQTEDNKVAFLKKPGRVEIAHAETAGDLVSIDYVACLVKDCWLGGDDVIKTEAGYLMGIRSKVFTLIEFKSSELVKL